MVRRGTLSLLLGGPSRFLPQGRFSGILYPFCDLNLAVIGIFFESALNMECLLAHHRPKEGVALLQTIDLDAIHPTSLEELKQALLKNQRVSLTIREQTHHTPLLFQRVGWQRYSVHVVEYLTVKGFSVEGYQKKVETVRTQVLEPLGFDFTIIDESHYKTDDVVPLPQLITRDYSCHAWSQLYQITFLTRRDKGVIHGTFLRNPFWNLVKFVCHSWEVVHKRTGRDLCALSILHCQGLVLPKLDFYYCNNLAVALMADLGKQLLFTIEKFRMRDAKRLLDLAGKEIIRSIVSYPLRRKALGLKPSSSRDLTLTRLRSILLVHDPGLLPCVEDEVQLLRGMRAADIADELERSVSTYPRYPGMSVVQGLTTLFLTCEESQRTRVAGELFRVRELQLLYALLEKS